MVEEYEYVAPFKAKGHVNCVPAMQFWTEILGFLRQSMLGNSKDNALWDSLLA